MAAVAKDITPTISTTLNEDELQAAAYMHQWDAVSALIKAGDKTFDQMPSSGSDKDLTILWWATDDKQKKIVEELLEVGAKNVDAVPAFISDKTWTVLWRLADGKQWPLVLKVLQAGAKNVHQPSANHLEIEHPQHGPNKGLTVLWMATDARQWAIASMLLKILLQLEIHERHLDVAPESGPNKGLTALWLASAHQKWDFVLELLAAGAKNLNAAPKSGPDRGVTAFWMAIFYKQWAAASALLKAGASILPIPPEWHFMEKTLAELARSNAAEQSSIQAYKQFVLEEIRKIFNLIKKLEEYGSSRKVFAETAKLRLCSPTLLDIVLDAYESSTLLELAENLIKEHGQEAERCIEDILKRAKDPKGLLWLFCLPASPFGQVSFFLKDGRYIGRCRFYLPEGEKVPHVRGGNSGGPQGLLPGLSEMSIHLLEKFTGQGYGSEGLKMAVEILIKPAVGTRPLVYAGADADNKPCLKPSAFPFLGLATTTGLKNIPSIKASINAGFVPGRFVYVAGSSAGYPGYLDFRYPHATEETKVLQEFLREWINTTKLLGIEYME